MAEGEKGVKQRMGKELDMEKSKSRKTWGSQDMEKLAICLQKLPPMEGQYVVEFNTAPEKLLDCVLSLHRPYDGFVVPRVRMFKSNHPYVDTLVDLCECVARCGDPVEFYRSELNYDYEDAAEMFVRVLSYLVKEMNNYPGTTDLQKLQRWAVSVNAEEYKKSWNDAHCETNIPLFGIAGWQYLRMLFGADTCKPDIAIKGFIKDCLKRSFSDLSVVKLMEAAAPLVPELRTYGQPIREADRRIWSQYNAKSKHNRKKKSSCH